MNIQQTFVLVDNELALLGHVLFLWRFEVLQMQLPLPPQGRGGRNGGRSHQLEASLTSTMVPSQLLCLSQVASFIGQHAHHKQARPRHNRHKHLSRVSPLCINIIDADDDEQFATFEEELNKTALSIFHPITDLGYFSWNPPPAYNNYKGYLKPLNQIQYADEITQYLDLQGKPDLVRPIELIETPKKFWKPPKGQYSRRTLPNKFPFGEWTESASLHVAVQVG